MINLQTFLNSNWCIDNPWNDGYLVEDPDDMFDTIEINNEQELAQCIEGAKQLSVYEKDYFHITKDVVQTFLDQVEQEGRNIQSFENYIYDYADNWCMDYWDEWPERMDIIKAFVKQYSEDKSKCNIDILVGEFNDAQDFYTSGKLVGYIDLSKEMEDYLQNEYKEEYARFKKMSNKKLSCDK